MGRREGELLTCGEVQARIYPLLLRTISHQERLETLAHTASCHGCRLALETARGRLRGVAGLVTPEPSEAPRSRRRPRRTWLVFLPVVPAAIAFGLLFQQGIKLARYRYEQRFVARLEKALLLYREDFGKFPPANGAPLATFLGTEERNGPYLDLARERRDGVGHFVDFWGNRYLFTCPGKQGRNPRLFDIQSYGQNRRDDGGRGDDITNWEEGWEKIPRALD